MDSTTLPRWLYTADQVKQGEVLAAKRANIALYQLMERAGRAILTLIQRLYPDDKSLTILCGTGNNGGDGFVVARLARQAGYDVTLWLSGDESKLQGDAETAMLAFVRSGGEIRYFKTEHHAEALKRDLLRSALIVDALLGTGLKGSVRQPTQAIIDTVSETLSLIPCPVISVDVPSGLCADSGTRLGIKGKSPCIAADHTLTFIGIKRGLVTGEARAVVGQLHFDGLEVDEYFSSLISSNTERLSQTEMQALKPERHALAHKGDHGRLLCVGGNQGYGGAIRLCAQAAARSGAGLVRVLCHPQNVTALQVACPEVMSEGWREDLAMISCRFAGQKVLAIGPGLGQDAWSNALYDHAAQYEQVKVVDADGLNRLATQPNYDERRVITPHPGEAARLLACSVAEVEVDRFAAIKALQQRYGGTVVLKGAGTLIYDGEVTSVCLAGNPGMASGGVGDVLTGIIAALLAQGLSLSNAAKLGVYLHSLAADELARREGQIGLLASDLIAEVRCQLNQ